MSEKAMPEKKQSCGEDRFVRIRDELVPWDLGIGWLGLLG